jgi:hypothetical protein
VLDAYLDGALPETLKQRAEQGSAESPPQELRPEEKAVLAFLEAQAP